MSLEFYHELLVDTEAWRELTSDNRAFAHWICQLITAPGVVYTQPWLIDAIYRVKDELDGVVLPAIKHKFRCINSPDLLNALADAGVTWEKPDDLGWWWDGWYRDHYTNLAGVAADPHLRAMAIRELSVTDIISHIDLFLAHEPVKQLAAAFLDRVYENRQVYLFSYIGSFGSRITDLAHPELWLINAQAMNRIFAFDPVIELAAYIKVSKRKAARLLEDADYANSCGPDIAKMVVKMREIERLFAENRAVVRESAVGYSEREGHWGTIIHNIIKDIEKRFG
ncbi:MAG: hypothetical protein ACFNLI_12675 [Corynebacterium matruchotii]